MADTACTIDALPALQPPPSASRILSTDVLKRRIQERVEQRNGMIVKADTGERHYTLTASEIFAFLWKHKFQAFSPSLPTQAQLDQVFPVQPINWEQLQNFHLNENANDIHHHHHHHHSMTCTWMGHASVLVQMNGIQILTDPNFSQRCSPSQWFGPLRYRPPPCTIEELTSRIPLDVVLLSHNHYDHLDYNTIRQIAASAATTAASRQQLTFVVPLGLRSWLVDNIPEITLHQHAIVEMDWHETVELTFQQQDALNMDSDDVNANNNNNNNLKRLKISAVPMRHWSNRTGDRDETLWCGYVCHHQHVQDETDTRFLFCGDTAWFEDLTALGQQYGPFDLAAIPIGAYEPRDFMKSHHVNPAEAVQLMTACQVQRAVPIHYGTFPLTQEPVMEPPTLLQEEMKRAGKDPATFAPWLIGETILVEKEKGNKYLTGKK